jgi:hypothetical protein
MYVNIEIFRCNEGYYGIISEEDISEILDILNLDKLTQRVILSEEFFEFYLKPVINELENETEKSFLQGKINQQMKSYYDQNCHSLTRKSQEKLG